MLNKTIIPTVALALFLTFFEDFYRKYFIDYEMAPPVITMEEFKKGLDL